MHWKEMKVKSMVVHWKELREQVKHYLQRAVDGKEVKFRHQMFYGYEFQIVAKKKEVK